MAMPISLNIVNFRYVSSGAGISDLNALNKKIEIELQEQLIAVPSTVNIRGTNYLHVAITNHRSRREDFDLLITEVIRIGDDLLALNKSES